MPEISTLLGQPAPERFDGAEARSKLPSFTQDWIGAIALELVLAWHLLGLEGPGPESALSPLLARAGSASDSLLMSELEEAVTDALPSDAFTAADGALRISLLLGGVCRVCGCSQNGPCDTGCSWAAEDLCTACVEGGHDHA